MPRDLVRHEPAKQGGGQPLHMNLSGIAAVPSAV